MKIAINFEDSQNSYGSSQKSYGSGFGNGSEIPIGN